MSSSLDTLMKTPMPKKIFFLAFIMLMLAAAFWFSFYSPLTEEYASEKTRYDTLKRKLADAEQRRRTYEEDRKRRDEMQKASTKQFQALPPDTEMSSFLASLNAQADVVGLEILSVRPMQEEVSQYYARIPVQLELNGTYHQLAKFFYLVGSLDRIINVENINLQVASVDKGGTMLRVAVLATTFRSVQTGGGPLPLGTAPAAAPGRSVEDEKI